MSDLRIIGARENNLRGFDVVLPHDRLVVITGVSGSGKSSLAFDTIFREGERRYLGAIFRSRLLGKIDPPEVDRLEGVRPAIAIDQRAVVANARSTVQTISEVGDELRLLFARFGRRPDGDLRPLTRSLFSFNTERGACPRCRGLGVEDHVDPNRIVADPDKTLREGALVPTTPNGYIVYSQVTPDVLNTVCAAHGFDIDTRWRELTEDQKNTIFFGSDRVEVPFGKHSLESRMKWSGIKAKPRELGYYRGIANVIAETLEKKRNDNILRFVTSRACSACRGTRYSEEARSVRFGDRTIAEVCARTLAELPTTLAEAHHDPPEAAQAILDRIRERIEGFVALGLGHLDVNRATGSLSSGEARRLRLANQLHTELSGVAYVFDEPSVGAHVEDRERIAQLLLDLRDRKNSVFVVEHDTSFVTLADHLVTIGPGAGRHGGQLVFSGTPTDAHRSRAPIDVGGPRREGPALVVHGARANNLKNIDVTFRVGAFNVVSGVSGAGKSTLVDLTLARALGAGSTTPGDHDRIEGHGSIRKIVVVDQREIGRTPRSNPATYSGVFDAIRTRFAATDEAVARGFDKGRFSFNKRGGRCETCEGAGVEMIGLMSLPSVAIVCGSCRGERFDADTLAVSYRGRSIRQVLDATIEEAAELFADDATIIRILGALRTVGLGYLTLGQPATTLSGGEAQRLKLAKELAKDAGRGTLIVLDEPTSGLSGPDIAVLIRAIDAIVERGATVVAVEHDLEFIAAADWVVDLGPGAGEAGGSVVVAGTPADVAEHPGSKTGRALRGANPRPARRKPVEGPSSIRLGGVRTNNLKDVDVTFEHGALTVVTGVSGSGKTSLAFDSLAALGRQRFIESFSPFVRRHLRGATVADVDRADGLRPTVAIRARTSNRDPRSTVSTFSGVDALLRLMFSRLGEGFDFARPTAGHFSFNHALGACPRCDGRGIVLRCDAEHLVLEPTRSIADGALATTRGGRLLFETEGRLHATLIAFLKSDNIDPNTPWSQLDDRARHLVTKGAGDRSLGVEWRHAKKMGEAAHSFTATWPGVETLVEDEFEKRRGRKAAPAFEALLTSCACETCEGERLRPHLRRITVRGKRIHELRTASIVALLGWFDATDQHPVQKTIAAQIRPRLQRLVALGLGYLQPDRATATLSTGERRRLEIATQLVGGMIDVCYVLDEPCLGLHTRDREALADALVELAHAGNVVVAVDHAETIVRRADRNIVLGPGAGAAGGSVVAAPAVHRPLVRRRTPSPTAGPRIRGATANNLRSADLDVAFGEMLGLCGVSGSGKTSLVFDVLARSLEAGHAVGCRTLHEPAPVVRIDARPIAGGPMSTVATYLGLLDAIAKRYAASAEAKSAGLTRAAFLFGGKKGRCPTCEGTGVRRIAMDFLPDAIATCEPCGGTRYSSEVLAVTVDGRHIADVLASTVDAALTRGDGSRAILERLQAFGLGHLTLDRRVGTLSGGESQRVAMVKEMTSPNHATPRVFVFDEPTRGLHPSDVVGVLDVFEQLIEAGHAVVFTEHDLALLGVADRVVELGPDAGEDGGTIVFAGAPNELSRADTPTGRAIRDRQAV